MSQNLLLFEDPKVELEKSDPSSEIYKIKGKNIRI
jgi:hypothetical protein